jgi:peptidoglycan/xylan/chitin deacetylase (PgdA/CDA1 family)
MPEGFWKNGAKAAFAFCFDLDGDTIWMNKIRHLPGWDQMLKTRSVGSYGPNRGADTILSILRKYELKTTFFVPGSIAERYTPLIERILADGHELGHHGFLHEDDYGSTPDEQLALIEKSQQIFKRISGKKAVGFRCTGALLTETKKNLYNDPNTLYISIDIDDEKSGFIEVDGEKTKAVRVPCRQELDDYIQTVYNHYPPIPTGLPAVMSYEDTVQNFKRELEGAIRYGNAVSTAFHPQISGTPGRSVMLENLCEYVTQNPDIWCTSCEDIANWWLSKSEEA